MSQLLKKDIWNNLSTEDIFILDRGFRDAIKDINAKNFVAKMPDFSEKASGVLITEQANNSRLITKIRYIVEIVNGRLKEWFCYFDRKIHNSTLLYLFDDFKIAYFLRNIMHQPIRYRNRQLYASFI